MHNLRSDFPILSQKIHGKPLVYLDNAATSQKPRAVIEAIRKFYEEDCANVHRGVHTLSERATKQYEETREKVRAFLGAEKSCEIIFTRGTTEAINLVAHSFGKRFIKAGDEILISALEHHSNIVPWQMLCENIGATLKVIPINKKGELLLDEYAKLLNPRVKMVAVNHASNALGTINPVKEIIGKAHQAGAAVLIDGAQALPHFAADVRELDADFYAFSGHKIFGPTGIGVLYGKEKLLKEMPPYQGGGDMIASVTFEKTTYNVLPHKFEAGTPAIAEVIGLGATLDYLKNLDWKEIRKHEDSLLHAATETLQKISGLTLIGTAAQKVPVVSFTLKDVHPHDIATILDQEGIAVRAGHHCAQPVMEFFGIPATTRASFAFYNTHEEIEKLAEGLKKVLKIFG